MSTIRSFEPRPGHKPASATARRLLRLGVGCAALAWSALAAAGVQQWATVAVGNNHAQNPGGSYYKQVALGYRASSSSRLIDTGVASQDFTGLSADGNVETESFVGQAMAHGGFGSIKLGVSYSLTNRLANGANPNYVNADFSVNPGGVPNNFSVTSDVRVSDTIAVTGGGGLDSLEFTYRLTGHISTVGDVFNRYLGSNSYLMVRGFLASSIYGDDYFYDGSIDQLMVGRVKVVNGVASYGISMYANAGLSTVYSDMPWLTIGRDSSGVVDFMHSMDLVSVVGLAADGSPVALTSMIGSTGFDYLATAVPEPQSFVLLLAGLGAIAWRRRAG